MSKISFVIVAALLAVATSTAATAHDFGQYYLVSCRDLGGIAREECFRTKLSALAADPHLGCGSHCRSACGQEPSCIAYNEKRTLDIIRENAAEAGLFQKAKAKGKAR